MQQRPTPTALGICKTCTHLGDKAESGWCTNHPFFTRDKLPYVLYDDRKECGGYIGTVVASPAQPQEVK